MPGMPGMFAGGMNPMLVHKPKGKGAQPLDKWAHVAAGSTVYVNNLNERTGRDAMVNGLREVFSQYGKVLEVVMYTKLKRCKGQAWVVMERTESASKAVGELQNFIMFSKPMRVAFSKNVSDATLRRQGKAVPQRQRPPKRRKVRRRSAADEAERAELAEAEADVDAEQSRKRKKRKGAKAKKKEEPRAKAANKQRGQSAKQLAPNKTLFLQKLPPDAAQEELHRLFMGFPGFCGVKLIDNKPGIGFAEFDDTYNSANAQRSLNGFSLRGHDMSVEFCKV